MDDLTPFVELAARLAPGGQLVRAWPLRGGVSAQVHGLELTRSDGSVQRLVVRDVGADWKNAAGVTAQFRVLEALHARGFPVPEPRFLDAEASTLPKPGFVMALVEGTTDVPELNVALPQMADVLAQIHALDPESLRLPELERLEAPRPGLPRCARASLLHGDYWPGNIIWRDDALVAVLDWEDVAIGDPLADLAGARLELLWRYDHDVMSKFAELYFARNPMDATALPHWEIYVGEAAAASMANWGLEPAVEREMRARAERFVADARQRSTEQ